MVRKLIWLALILSACNSPTRLLKRADRLIKKAEQYGAVWHNDTTIIRVPVVLTETKHDTLIDYRHTIDTFTVIKNKITTKIKIDTLNKKIYVNVYQPADTVYAEAPCVTSKTIKSGYTTFQVLACIGFGVVVGFLLRMIFDRSRHPP